MAENIRAEVQTINTIKTILDVSWTLGASGAVASQTPAAEVCGLTVAKTGSETGRYTITPYKSAFSRIKPVGVVVEGPADTAMGNTDANAAVTRNVGTTTFQVQLMLASSGADTESTSGNKVHATVLCEE